MKDKKKDYLGKFEVLSETKSGSLVGGFSKAMSGGATVNREGTNLICTNNCNGGNCVKGCGTADA